MPPKHQDTKIHQKEVANIYYFVGNGAKNGWCFYQNIFL